MHQLTCWGGEGLPSAKEKLPSSPRPGSVFQSPCCEMETVWCHLSAFPFRTQLGDGGSLLELTAEPPATPSMSWSPLLTRTASEQAIQSSEWTWVACKHARTMQLSKTLGSRTQLGGAANAGYPILVCLSQQSPSEASAIGGRAVSAQVHSSVAQKRRCGTNT